VSTSPTEDPEVAEAGPVDVPPSTLGPEVPEAEALDQSREVPPPD
jgi:hypothetical protein